MFWKEEGDEDQARSEGGETGAPGTLHSWLYCRSSTSTECVVKCCVVCVCVIYVHTYNYLKGLRQRYAEDFPSGGLQHETR